MKLEELDLTILQIIVESSIRNLNPQFIRDNQLFEGKFTKKPHRNTIADRLRRMIEEHTLLKGWKTELDFEKLDLKPLIITVTPYKYTVLPLTSFIKENKNNEFDKLVSYELFETGISSFVIAYLRNLDELENLIYSLNEAGYSTQILHIKNHKENTNFFNIE